MISSSSPVAKFFVHPPCCLYVHVSVLLQHPTFKPVNMAPQRIGAVCARRLPNSLSRLSYHSTPVSQQRNAGFHPAKKNVPPESPSYIDVPQPPQSGYTPQARVRGALPVPKRVFLAKASKTEPKMRPEYLAKTAAEPTNAASQRPADPDSKVHWRRLMASQRRDNLKAGLDGLFERKRTRDATQERRGRARFAANVEARLAPEREDDRITRPSLAPLPTAIAPDPARFAKAAESAARVAALEQKRREERRDALMDLYVNASKFIVTEAQLRERVDELFHEDYFEMQGKAFTSAEDNAFAVWGAQSTLGRMAARSVRQQNSPMFATSDTNRTAKRQKKVAEELMGGKLDG